MTPQEEGARKRRLVSIDASIPHDLVGVPENSRATLKGFEWLQGGLTDPAVNAKVKGHRGIAEKLDCTLAQLAIAWCAKNPRVSTVITGASSVEQVKENLKALKIVSKLTPDVLKTIDAAIA